MTIPLFKSHYSIAKSILTIPKIFEFPEETIIIVEDSMSGFRRAVAESKKTNKKLIFGLRIDCKQNQSDGSSKLVFFAKDAEGVKKLRKIYTLANTGDEGNNFYDLSLGLEHLHVVVPFYDSYIYNSLFKFGTFNLDLPPDVEYFEEDNGHPHDLLLAKKLDEMKIERTKVKTILYAEHEDVHALQFLKAVEARSGNRETSIDCPNLEGFCSNRFCYQDIQYD
jgi:hypothetical protein